MAVGHDRFAGVLEKRSEPKANQRPEKPETVTRLCDVLPTPQCGDFEVAPEDATVARMHTSSGERRFMNSSSRGSTRWLIAHFGTYVFDEADKSFTFRIDSATFPNWNTHRPETFFRHDRRRTEIYGASRVSGWNGRSHLETREITPPLKGGQILTTGQRQNILVALNH